MLNPEYTPPEESLEQLWLLYSKDRTRLRKVDSIFYSQVVHRVKQRITHRVHREPEKVIKKILKNRDNAKQTQLSLGRPELTVSYVVKSSIVPLHNIALAVYSPYNPERFKFWFDVITGGREAFVSLGLGIESLRGSTGEILRAAEEEMKKETGSRLPNPFREELLKRDPSGFILLDTEARRIRIQCRKPESLTPYRYIGAGLVRDVYKLVYPLTENLPLI